jgi:hypothetical protein
MYAFLLIFGTAIVAAGIALIGSGVSIQDHTFDPTVITPGAIAVIGGLILIGLAFVLQQLRNLERAIVSRSVIGSVQSGAAPGMFVPETRLNTAVPVPHEAAVESIKEAPALTTPAAQEAERLREKFPSLLRLDNASVAEESDPSLLPKPPVRADEEVNDAENVVAVRQAVGANIAPSGPRLDVNVRPNGGSARVRNIDAFWPKRKRPGQGAPAVVLRTTTPPPPTEPVLPMGVAPSSQPDPAMTEVVGSSQASMPVSILKSGVVDGMAYTLYSDGSIEAQLPQGTLRFGSITELRNHIEQSA